jgi:hypothetical protein
MTTVKTSYQQYQLEIVRHSKRIGVKPEEILPMYQNLIAGNQTDDVMEEYWRAIIETSIYVKDAIHIFVGDENFIDWIIEATPSLEDGMCEFWEHAFTQNVCVFHFPTKSKLITFAA